MTSIDVPRIDGDEDERPPVPLSPAQPVPPRPGSEEVRGGTTRAQRAVARVGNRAQETTAGVAAVASQQDTPEDYARAMRIGGVGKPMTVDGALSAARGAGEARTRAVDEDHDGLLATHPALAKWLGVKANAGVSSDDLPALAEVERATRKAARPGILSDIEHGLATGAANLAGHGILTAMTVGGLDPEIGIPRAAGFLRTAESLGLTKPEAARRLEETIEPIGAEMDVAAGRVGRGIGRLGRGALIRGDPDFVPIRERERFTVDDPIVDFALDFGRAFGELFVDPAVDIVAGTADVAGGARNIAGELLTQPRGTAHLLSEQALVSAPGIVLGAAGGIAGGAPGAIAGLGTGIAGMEHGARVAEELRARGFNPGDEDSLRAAFADPEMMADINRIALAKAGGTAVVETAFAGVLGVGLGRRIAGGQTGRLGDFLGATALDALGGAGGEVAGGLAAQAAGSEIPLSALDVTLEGLLEVPFSGVEVGGIAAATLAGRATAPVRNAVARKAQATARQKRFVELVGKIKEAKTTQRSREATADLLNVVLDGMPDPETASIGVSREAWDDYHVAAGLNPAETVQAIIPATGARVYAESAQTGSIDFPYSDMAVALSERDDVEAVSEILRLAPGEDSVAEATAETEAATAAVEEAVRGGAKLFQEELDLRNEAAALDEELAAIQEPAEGEPAIQAAPEIEAKRTRRTEIATRLTELETERAEERTAVEETTERLVSGLTDAGLTEPQARVSVEPYVALAETLAERFGTTARAALNKWLVQIGDGISGAAEQAGRAFTTFGAADPHGNRVFGVTLLADMDLSSFLHEAVGHVGFEMLGDMAATEGAPAGIVEMYDDLREFAGLDSHEQHVASLDEIDQILTRVDAKKDRFQGKPSKAEAARLAVLREPLERIARGMEAFLREGKAPSPRLRRAFAAIAAWLTRIYRNLRSLNIELTPEVRQTFAQMLATDEEIAAAEFEAGVEPLPDDVLEGASEEAVAAVREAEQAAADAAREDALVGEMKHDEKIRKALEGERLDQVREEVREEAEQTPAVVALSELRENKIVRNSVEDGDTLKTLTALGVIADDGTALRIAIENFGFGSEEGLVQGLTQADQVDKAIEVEARRRVVAEFQQPRRAVKALMRRAEVASEERSRALQAQHKAIIDRHKADIRALPTVAQFRERARQMLAPMPLRTIKPHTFLASTRRLSSESFRASAAGRSDDAIRAMGSARLNHELYREALKIKEQARKDTARSRRMGTPGFQKRLTDADPVGLTFVNQTNGILDRFQFRLISKPEAERRADLADFMRQRAEDGFPIALPERLRRETFKRDHQELTADELHAVRSALDAIYKQALGISNFLDEQRNQTIQQAADELVTAAKANGRFRQRVKGSETKLERSLEFLDEQLAAGVKASNYARIIDGGIDGGPAVRHIIRPLNDSTVAWKESREQMTAEHGALYTAHFDKRTRADLDKRREVPGAPGLSLTHEDRLSVYGLWGSPQGRQRLRQLFSQSQIDAIMAMGVEADAEFVQARWTWFDEWFDKVAEMHTFISGQVPVRRPRLPYTIAGVEMPGGYHKLAYKDAQSFPGKIKDWAMDSISARSASAMMEGGFLIEAQEEVTGHVRLDRMVITRHMDDLVFMLTMKPALVDVETLLKRRDVKKAIADYHGDAAVGALGTWVERVAAGNQIAVEPIGKVANYFRKGGSVAILGGRTLSSMKQLFGLRNIPVQVGRGGFRDMAEGTMALFTTEEGFFHGRRLMLKKSGMMRQRMKGSWERDVDLIQGDMLGGKKAAIRGKYFWLLLQAQSIPDQVAWYTGYVRAMRDMPADMRPDEWESEAVARADQFVKDTQGGGEAVDLAAWQSGNPLVRLLTAFFTDASLKFNQTKLSKSRTAWDDWASVSRFLSDMMLLYVTYGVVSGALMAGWNKLGWSDEDDDPEDAEGYISFLWRSTVSEMLDTIPLVRNFAGRAQGFQYRGSAGEAGFQYIDRGITALSHVLGDGEVTREDIFALNMALGVSLHYPAKFLNEVAQSVIQVVEGEVPVALVGLRNER